jgi:TRAP-type transport system periplasmic protein
MSALIGVVKKLRFCVAGAMLGLPALASAQVVLTASTWLAPSHGLSETQKEWCSQLEQRTAGKVKCNILPRAVAAPPATFDAVRNGLADLSFTVHGYTPGRFVHHADGRGALPGGFVRASSVAFQRMYARYPALAEEHRA